MENRMRQVMVVESTNVQVAQTQLTLHYQFLRDQDYQLPRFQDTGFRVFSENDEDGLLLYIPGSCINTSAFFKKTALLIGSGVCGDSTA